MPAAVLESIINEPISYFRIFSHTFASLAVVDIIFLFFIQRMNFSPSMSDQVSNIKRGLWLIVSPVTAIGSIVSIFFLSLAIFGPAKILKSRASFSHIFSFQLFFWMSWLSFFVTGSLILLLSRFHHVKSLLIPLILDIALIYLLAQYTRSVHKLLGLTKVKTALALLLNLLIFGVLTLLIFQFSATSTPLRIVSFN